MRCLSHSGINVARSIIESRLQYAGAAERVVVCPQEVNSMQTLLVVAMS